MAQIMQHLRRLSGALQYFSRQLASKTIRLNIGPLHQPYHIHMAEFPDSSCACCSL